MLEDVEACLSTTSERGQIPPRRSSDPSGATSNTSTRLRPRSQRRLGHHHREELARLALGEREGVADRGDAAVQRHRDVAAGALPPSSIRADRVRGHEVGVRVHVRPVADESKISTEPLPPPAATPAAEQLLVRPDPEDAQSGPSRARCRRARWLRAAHDRLPALELVGAEKRSGSNVLRWRIRRLPRRLTVGLNAEWPSIFTFGSMFRMSRIVGRMSIVST